MLSISGCSSKSIEKPQDTALIQEETLALDEEFSDDDFLQEFEDEMETEEIYDPFNSYNRMMTSFNDGLFEYVLIPVAKGYKAVIHEEIRKSVDNFFNNIYYPSRVVNNLLQGKFSNASEETGRFIINSTIGILGLFDVAKSKFNLNEHVEDFGQTLGFYGVKSGPHIVLPLLGPSNLRDTLSMYPDSLLNPIDYTEREWYTLSNTLEEYITLRTFKQLNSTSLNIDEYEKIKEDAIDLYPYLRDIYEQYREKQIRE